MKQVISTDKGAAPKGPYSQGVVTGGRLLYVAAQGPFDPRSGETVSDDFPEQAAQAFHNLLAVAEAAGAGPEDAVKVTVYLTDWAHFQAMNRVYQQFFPEPYPVRTPVQTTLPFGLIMVDGVFALPEGGGA